MEHEYFECQCDSHEHTLRFSYDEDENEIYTEVYLDSPTFFSRVVHAVRYVFGYKCKNGHWDCTLLKNEDIPRLIAFLDKTQS